MVKHRKYSSLLIILLGLITPFITHSTPNITYTKAQELSQAIAQLRAQSELTENLLNSCAQHFPQLSNRALSSLENWQLRNAAAVKRSIKLHLLLIESIRTHESLQAAEKYNLELETLIFNNTHKMQDLLTSYSDSDRYKVCKQLILSVDSKLWDLEYKYPTEYNSVMGYSF